jgi:hypothetical protein
MPLGLSQQTNDFETGLRPRNYQIFAHAIPKFTIKDTINGFTIGEVHDLGHNASVAYRSILYSCEDGSTFYSDEVSISDWFNCTTIIAKEALNLLVWLQQEKPKLEKMAKEEEV